MVVYTYIPYPCCIIEFCSIKLKKHKKMVQENLILDKLTEIANKLDEQNLLQKTVLNFNDACKHLDVSPSHLYKLTSARQIPHFCPQGKKLYFKREELDQWLQRNRQSTSAEIAEQVDEELVSRKRNK